MRVRAIRNASTTPSLFVQRTDHSFQMWWRHLYLLIEWGSP